ncbi:MAG: hypothetical protein ACLQGP_32850 [Isosphaeraceae bacterium]
MAQQDATEQAKEFLRQVIKYRFWISVSIAALFAVIAYFMGSGPVKAKTTAAIGEITGAEKAVKKFALPTVPTDAYKPIVEEKTQIVTKDVNKAWKELYDRQAPLLTWPETVQDRFRKWGRKWPETEDSARVQLAYVDYTYAYPAYVEMVYKSFNPFDYETGKGIVAAPPKEALLRPVQFSVEERPDLGKVWAAQERLWIQHTVLDVIAQVNKAATSWDSAIVKQVEALEVGNPLAQDQRSLANSEELKPADEILAPGQESSAAAEEGGGGGGMMAGMAMPGGGGGRSRGAMGGMAAMGAMGGMGGGGAASSGAKYDNKIYYITPAIDKGQYKILPILVTVLIDQDRVQDFLVELENSPMSIQVMDFELARPSSRVVKPEKGAAPMGGMTGMMGMMGGMGRMRGMMGGGQAGFGGMMGMMGQMGRGGMMREEGGMMGMMGGMRGGMAAAIPERKGTSIRGTDSKAEREKTLKEIEEKKGPSFFDPYFDIVEVTIYGKARFFLPPPEEPASEPSLGETPAATTSPAGAAGSAEEVAKAKPADVAATTGSDTTKKPADEQPAAKTDAEKPAAKADTEKPAAKADTEKPATKAGNPDGKGAASKS